MATILLIIIFMGFISLGIPDSIFGTAWPEIYSELSLPISFASFVTMITTFGTFVSSLFSARILNKFGTPLVAAVSTLFTAAALILISVTQEFVFLILLSFPLGLGGGAIDSGLNNYVALHYGASQMNFLHCFYGVGIALSPYVLSLILKNGLDWRGGYRVLALVQISIAVIFLLSLPLWKKIKEKNSGEDEEGKTLTFKELFGIKGIGYFWLMFFSSCALEFLTGLWQTTYLVDFKDYKTELAATVVTFYYIGIAAGRGFAGIVAKWLQGWRIIFVGLLEILLGIALLIITNNPILLGLGLFLIGFGNGPVYPALMFLVPKTFGREASQSVMSSQMSAASLGIMLAPALMGALEGMFGIWTFTVFLSILFAILIFSVTLAHKRFK